MKSLQVIQSNQKKKEGRVPPNDNEITRAESEQQEGKKHGGLIWIFS